MVSPPGREVYPAVHSVSRDRGRLAPLAAYWGGHGALTTRIPRPGDSRMRRRRVARAILVASLACLSVAAVLGVVIFRAHERRVFEQVGVVADEPGMAALLSTAEKLQPSWVLLVVDGLPSSGDAPRQPLLALVRIPSEGSAVRVLYLGVGTSVDTSDGVKPLWDATRRDRAATISRIERATAVSVDHYVELSVSGLSVVLDAGRVAGLRLAGASGEEARAIDSSAALNGYVTSNVLAGSGAAPALGLHRMIRGLARAVPASGSLVSRYWFVDTLSAWLKTDLDAGSLYAVAREVASGSVGPKNAAVAPALTRSGETVLVLDGIRRQAKAMQTGAALPDTGSPAKTVVPAHVSITVLNGAGIEGSAGEAARILRRAGYDVRSVGNANQFVYDSTLVVYEKDAAAARRVSSSLPVGRVVSSRGMYVFSTDVLVVIGKDWP